MSVGSPARLCSHLARAAAVQGACKRSCVHACRLCAVQQTPGRTVALDEVEAPAIEADAALEPLHPGLEVIAHALRQKGLPVLLHACMGAGCMQQRSERHSRNRAHCSP